MTLIMNAPSEMNETLKQVEDSNGTKKSNDELTIRIESEHEQNSPMSEEQKAVKRAESPSLYTLFQKTLESKGYPVESCEWNDEKELQADNLSSMTLHSFLLKAESLGKKITYSKSLKIKISD